MRNLPGLLLPLLLLTACATNRLDHAGNRQGRWRTYHYPDTTQLQATGRYRHNQLVGRWRYYTATGELDRRERFKRHGVSLLTYYYPDGHVWKKGTVQLLETARTNRYFWTGDWQVFNPNGTLQQVETYEQGKLVATRPVTPAKQ